MNVHDQSAIGESEMRAEGLAYLMGWQDGMELSLLEEQERIVLEPIGMVIHIVAVKEKRSVSGFATYASHCWRYSGVYLMISNMMSCVSDSFKHDALRI